MIAQISLAYELILRQLKLENVLGKQKTALVLQLNGHIMQRLLLENLDADGRSRSSYHVVN